MDLLTEKLVRKIHIEKNDEKIFSLQDAHNVGVRALFYQWVVVVGTAPRAGWRGRAGGD
jgi:hypothetical protein